MKKLIIVSAVAALMAAQSAFAVPKLILSDDNGHSATVTDGGAGDLQLATPGLITFSGAIGDWAVNVSTGIASPPLLGLGSATHPYVDLNSTDTYGTAGTHALGKVLTIQFIVDNVGPISGTLKHSTGGTFAAGGVSDEFIGILNGIGITDMKFTSSPFSGTATGAAVGGIGSTITLVAILTAGVGPEQTSFDTSLEVPDAGMTLALLGSALTGLALFARNRKTA